jgi:ubiquinone biosynthesis protein COQ4
MIASHRLRNTLRTVYAALMLGRRPNDVRYVFMVGDSQDNIAEAARGGGEIRDPFAADGELERMWRERYCPERYSVEEMLALPETTLGGCYARHMKQWGLRPDFYDDVPARHKLHYLRLRIRQTHDIWHVLTGYDTGHFGEVGLQGFYFGQFTNGQSVIIGAGAMLKHLLRGQFGELEHCVEAFCQGYVSGRRARSLLAVKWEQLWDQPLEALRERFGVAAAGRA